MSETKYSLETVRQVWNDKQGDRIEVGPDTDGLDLVSIRHKDDDSKTTSEITMPPEQALLVYEALGRTLREMGLLV